MRVFKIVKTIYDILLAVVAAICIIAYLVMLCMHIQSFVVLSGSMEPTIMIDDIVLIQPVDIKDVAVDDIITYDDNGTYVTHRVVEITNKGKKTALRMKGDNNNVTDRVLVTNDKLVGKYLTHIQGGGSVYDFIHTPQGLILIVFVPLGIYLILELIVYIGTPEKKKVGTAQQDEENAVSNDDDTVDS